MLKILQKDRKKTADRIKAYFKCKLLCIKQQNHHNIVWWFCLARKEGFEPSLRFPVLLP